MPQPPASDSVQVALVGSRPTPNLTPAIDPRTRPAEVILVVAPAMQAHADWLQDTLQPRGLQVSRWPVAAPWDINALRERILALVVEREGQPLVLNATGGTRPMSIAAYEVFRDLDLPVFYLHPDNDRLTWMHPWSRKGFNLEDRLKLPAFLQAHGNRIEGQIERRGIAAPLRELGHTLVRDIDRLSRPLGTLNWLASRARGDDLSVDLAAEQRRDRELDQLLDAFAAADALRRDGDTLRFPNDEARFFANGGWLEDYVYGVIHGLRGELSQIQDLSRGIEVCRGDRREPVRNELDVAFLAANRLYLIECKTRRFKRGGAQGPGAEALYKLDTLAPLLGGPAARAMLISYQPLSDPDLRRATELGINSCVGTQLHQLGDHIRRWIEANAPAG